MSVRSVLHWRFPHGNITTVVFSLSWGSPTGGRKGRAASAVGGRKAVLAGSQPFSAVSKGASSQRMQVWDRRNLKPHLSCHPLRLCEENFQEQATKAGSPSWNACCKASQVRGLQFSSFKSEFSNKNSCGQLPFHSLLLVWLFHLPPFPFMPSGYFCNNPYTN